MNFTLNNYLSHPLSYNFPDLVYLYLGRVVVFLYLFYLPHLSYLISVTYPPSPTLILEIDTPQFFPGSLSYLLSSSKLFLSLFFKFYFPCFSFFHCLLIPPPPLLLILFLPIFYFLYLLINYYQVGSTIISLWVTRFCRMLWNFYHDFSVHTSLNLLWL